MNKSKSIIAVVLLVSAMVFSSESVAQCGRCGPDGFNSEDYDDYTRGGIIAPVNNEAAEIKVNNTDLFLGSTFNTTLGMIDLNKKEEELISL